MVQRLTYRRRHAWRNASNKIRKVKTPGGKLALLYRVKSSSKPRCGDCHTDLQGIPCRRPKELRTLRRHERTVSRAYGGSRCATCVRSRSVDYVIKSISHHSDHYLFHHFSAISDEHSTSHRQHFVICDARPVR